MKKVKKIISILVVAIMTVGLMAGCGKEKTDPNVLTVAHCQGEWLWPTLEKITSEYEKRSGTRIELIYVPADGYATWQSAQFGAETEPDIIYGATDVKDLFTNGKIIDLTDYYNEENPYTGQKWIDDYINGILDDCKDSSGKKYIANSFSRTSPLLFYNKTAMKELGYDENMVPESWSDVLEICDKAKSDGKFIPFSVMNSTKWSLGWPIDKCLEDLFLSSNIVNKLDIIVENGKLDHSEILLGLKTGVIDYEDPRFVEYFSLMKKFSQYLNKGFNSASWEYENLFNSEKSVMTFNGGWYPGQVVEKGLKLEYGISTLPFVDKNVSEYGREKDGHYIGNLGEANVIVTKRCADNDKADKAVDFLRFMSDKNGGAKIFVDGSYLMPVTEGVELPDILKTLDENRGTDTMKYNLGYALEINSEAADKYWKAFSEFMENDSSPMDFAKQTKELMLPYVDQEISDRPELEIDKYIGKVKQ